MIEKRRSKSIKIGSVEIGGDAPVAIQTMTNTSAEDFCSTLEQLKGVEAARCDIARLAVPNEASAEVFRVAKENGIRMPLVADIHFDYRLALAAIRSGADKIRINPGNIGAEWKVKEVAEACKTAGVPIRIGVNGGSLDNVLLEKYGAPVADALVESALLQAEMLEKFGFSNTIISIKSSRTETMIEACRKLAAVSTYPLHLGVTEAGDVYSGIIKNAVGIGALLAEGIGDTIRVSLTADPVEEIKAAKEILSSLNLYNGGGIEIISCPTCGRTRIDLIALSSAFREAVSSIDTNGKKITVALMGCAVNGPGEAREADVGIAGGDGFALLFRHGEIICRVEENECVARVVAEIKKIIST